jgi:hypothetical protein
MMAASGEPNACLTLTCNPTAATTVVERYRALHAAWKTLVKRMLRQFALAPEKRWLLKTDDGYLWQDIRNKSITSETPQKAISAIHYMAFAEETEKGEPHLHILLRTEFIPQNWISQQMKDLLNSPIVWIEKVKGKRSAIAYVSKYVTEAPAQFGTSKRYWMSKKYRLIENEKDEEPIFEKSGSHLVHQSFTDLAKEIVLNGYIPIPLGQNVIRLYRPSTAIKVFGDGEEWKSSNDLLRAWQYLSYLRDQPL